MTIKYECDECGQEVYGPEALGEGVVVYQGDHVHIGKAYVFEDADSPLVLNISITSRSDMAQHFCMACMWRALERMMTRYAPGEVEVNDPVASAKSALAKAWDEVTDRKPQPSDGPDYHAEIAAWNERHPSKESHEEATTAATGPDNELSELYAEGVLPTPGADERADESDDPGLDSLDHDVPNGPEAVARWNEANPPRPGWEFRTTANGI